MPRMCSGSGECGGHRAESAPGRQQEFSWVGWKDREGDVFRVDAQREICRPHLPSSMPDGILGTLQIFTYFMFQPSCGNSSNCHYSHFTEEEAEAHGSSAIRPGTCSSSAGTGI